MALSLHVLSQEATVAKAEDRLVRLNAAIASGAAPNISVRDMALDAPPRARLADALALSRAAQFTLDDTQERTALLDSALARLQSIGNTRPYWGEFWSTRAFAQSMRLGPRATKVRESLNRSYRDAPYLSRAGAWRIAYGFAYWNDLNDLTQDRVLNEAVWLARSSPVMLDSVLTLARQSPAYRAYVVHWMAARQGDIDFRPLQRTAP
ncbi:MAG: hypothetical protein WA070_00655 [Sphingobium sp.]